MTDADVIVIGGGAAGLAGATTLARARRDVLLVDAGQPRNAPAAGVHAFLSRDGIAPAELYAEGRRELASYGGRVVTGSAVGARRTDDGFEVDLADGRTLAARGLLVATGAVDELPDIPGLRERWGRDVVHCPYCHGWEVREQPIVVVATTAMLVHQGLMWSQWSDDVTLVLNGRPEPGPEEAAQLAARGVRVVAGPVDAVVADESDRLAGVSVEGRLLPAAAVVVNGLVRARSAVTEALGLATEPVEMAGEVIATRVAADETGRTAIPGVFVAGNLANPMAQVVSSAAGGTMAAAMLNMDLVLADAAGPVSASASASASG